MSTTLSRRSFIGAAGATVAAAAGATGLTVARADETAAAAAPLTADVLNQQWSFEIAPEPITDIAETVDCELVVVGGGTSASRPPARAPRPGSAPSSSRVPRAPVCRGGSNHCTYSKVMEREGVERYDVENFYLSELAANSFKVDNRKWYKFYNNSEETDELAARHALRGGLRRRSRDHQRRRLRLAHQQPGGLALTLVSPDMQMAGVGQAFAVNTLAKNIEAAGGRIFWETVAKQLVRGGKPNGTEGRVEGVICQKADGTFVQYNASKGVVLATGDFSRDKDMMAKYCPWCVELIDWENNQDYDYDFGLHPNEPLGIFHGDGHKMGLWVGAAWQKVYPNAPMAMFLTYFVQLRIAKVKQTTTNGIDSTC